MAVRSSSRLQKLRQQQIEEGTLIPEDKSWQILSKDLKPRKWHKVPVKVGGFMIMKWQPVDQKEPTPGLGRPLYEVADHAHATVGRSRRGGRGRARARGRGRGKRGAAGRPVGSYTKKRAVEQVDDYVYYGGTSAPVPNPNSNRATTGGEDVTGTPPSIKHQQRKPLNLLAERSQHTQMGNSEQERPISDINMVSTLEEGG